MIPLKDFQIMKSLKSTVFVLSLLQLIQDAETVLNSGREFILLYPELKGSNGPPVLGAYLLGTSAPITLTLFETGTLHTPFALTSAHTYEVFAPSSTIYGSGKFTQMVRVTTDVDVAVFGVSHTDNRGELYSGIPVSALGRDYYAVTYCEVAGQPCQISIASMTAGTEVTVTLPSNTNSITVNFMGTTYSKGQSFIINLDKDQVAQIQSEDDLTGTRIKSNTNVAVFSGSSGTTIQGGNEGFLLKPLPPVNTWGKQHIAVRTPSRTMTGDYFRIITSESNTLVSISGESPVNIPNIGQWIQRNFSNTAAMAIISDKPVLVVRMSVSERQPGEPGQPTMVVLVPNEQFLKGIDVFVPKITSTTSNVITVVTKSKNTATILTEATPVTGWVPVPGSVYRTAEITVNLDYNKISSTDPQAEFAVYFYGDGNMSNAYTGGRDYADINPPCSSTTMSIGDEVDNDCDGLIDEDTCTPTDFAGKDCALIVSGERDVYGTEFVFGFPYHIDLALQFIFVTSMTPGVTVTLEEPNIAGVLETKALTGTTHHFSLLTTQQVQPSDLSNKTMRLTATREITAFALSTRVTGEVTGGAFRILPTEGLGREYMAVTYCENNMCFILISAVHPDTQIQIHLNLLNDVSPVTFRGSDYKHGDTISIELVQYESAQILSSVDMTGSRISANKPISVITGGQYTVVKKSRDLKDMVVEQLVPVQALGQLAAIVQSPGRLTNSMACSSLDCRDYMRIVAVQDSTYFTLSMSGSTTDYILDFQGEFQDIELMDRAVVESDKPIVVVQLLTQGPITFDGGMLVVVPVEQYSNGDRLNLPSGADIGGSSDLYARHILVIANQSDTATIMHDGTAFTSWENLPALLLASAFKEATSGEMEITGPNDSTIGGYITANVHQFAPATFTFPVAFKLNKINVACSLTPSVPGDGIDNDCDGLEDEENCTAVAQEDDDFDGMFDEDCQYHSVASPSATPTSTLLHQSSSEVSVFPSSTEHSTPLLTTDASTYNPTESSALSQSVSSFPAPEQISSLRQPSSSSSPLFDLSISSLSPSPTSSETLITSKISGTVSNTFTSRFSLTPSVNSLRTSIAPSVPEDTSITPSQTVTESLELSPGSSQEASTTPLQTSPVIPAPASHSCTCICSSLTVLDRSSLTEVVASIRKALIVDKETVSQTIRKKISVPDHRPSAVSMGYLGVAVISSLFVGIFALDAGSLFRDIVSLFKTMQESCQTKKNESKA